MLPTIWVPSQPCRFRVCRSLLLVATFIASILVAPSAHAATIEVTTTVDELNTDGDCSLREAIIAANEDRVVDACAAGNGRDTITLVPGRYELSIYEWSEDSGLRGGDIDITTDLDITTSGAGTTTINGMLNNRVFDIHASATVSITNLTIQGGSLSGLASDADAVSGAGIRNRGVLTIKNSTVANNTAGGPACKCGGYEGRGGGIYSSGTLLLVNTTISNNTALGVGFTPDKGGRGGGIANDGTLTISSSTISHNEAGRTAGGVDNGGTLRTWNTLIGQNHLDDCRGTLNSLGYNLIQDLGGCVITGEPTGNIVGKDPLLGPLQNNGGPTPTHALLFGSPAIDAADTSRCSNSDQRGSSRPADGQGDGIALCDIGAYELEKPYIAFFLPIIERD